VDRRCPSRDYLDEKNIKEDSERGLRRVNLEVKL